MTYVPQVRVVYLRSKQGRDIEIDYVISATSQSSDFTGYQAGPIRLVVLGSSQERMTAVLVNRFYIPGDEGMSEHVYVRELVSHDGRLSAEIHEPVDAIIQLFGSSFETCQPQFALCIDGVWQVDPVQPGEQHNFNFAWIV